MAEILFKEESFRIIGLCMEIHRTLGMGFKEAVYKDALELELQNHRIPYTREQMFEIVYKGKILPHKYIADLIIQDKIILEVKATSMLADASIAQTINYLKASTLRLGLIINFGEPSLTYKRLVL
jgi:GxxExxY protein